MTDKNRLKCEYCDEEHFYTPIIEKPSRFAFNGRIHQLVNENDNICLDCLREEIEHLKEFY